MNRFLQTFIIILGVLNVALAQTLHRTVTVTAVKGLPSCYANCTVGESSGTHYWQKQTITATLTAATIITIINRDRNTTRYVTSYNELPEGYTFPPTNSLGTQTATLTVTTRLGESEVVTLTYPTGWAHYALNYTWGGILPTVDPFGQSICSSGHSMVVPYTGAYPPQHPVTATIDAKDPQGLIYTLNSYTCGNCPDPKRAPGDAAPQLCPCAGVCAIQVLKTAALLTVDSTSFESDTTTTSTGLAAALPALASAVANILPTVTQNLPSSDKLISAVPALQIQTPTPTATPAVQLAPVNIPSLISALSSGLDGASAVGLPAASVSVAGSSAANVSPNASSAPVQSILPPQGTDSLTAGSGNNLQSIGDTLGDGSAKSNEFSSALALLSSILPAQAIESSVAGNGNNFQSIGDTLGDGSATPNTLSSATLALIPSSLPAQATDSSVAGKGNNFQSIGDNSEAGSAQTTDVTIESINSQASQPPVGGTSVAALPPATIVSASDTAARPSDTSPDIFTPSSNISSSNGTSITAILSLPVPLIFESILTDTSTAVVVSPPASSVSTTPSPALSNTAIVYYSKRRTLLMAVLVLVAVHFNIWY